MGGGVTWAEGSLRTPYGTIVSGWRAENGQFTLNLTVPAGTTCQAVLPDGTARTYGSGSYTCSCPINA